MINPQQCLTRVLQDGSVDALYDLLIWVRSVEGAHANAELNILLRDLFARTEEAIKHQRRYDKRKLSRVGRAKTIDATGSHLAA